MTMARRTRTTSGGADQALRLGVRSQCFGEPLRFRTFTVTVVSGAKAFAIVRLRE